jgi:hypothetical protein
MNAPNSKLIGRIGAKKVQQRARECGDLVIWVIYERPADFPEFYVARPFIGERGLPVHMLAKELAILRQRLPAHLYPMMRNAFDDPVILETWI